MVARERLLMTELALQCYRSDQGSGPARLEDLVTNYLARVPENPFTGQPLVYRGNATHWLLYNVGWDGVDHGGVSKGKGSSGKDDIFLDSPW